MNEIFKAKRKIHYLINVAFYLLFFIAGFLIGGGKIEKISDIFSSIF